MTTSQPRKPAGTPTGGQFAASSRPRPNLELEPEPRNRATQVAREQYVSDVEWLAARVSSGRGWESRVSVDGESVWVEFAASTHDGNCPDCGESQPTGPAWDYVENGEVTGALGGGQCGGCGGIGRGWAHSGAVEVGRADRSICQHCGEGLWSDSHGSWCDLSDGDVCSGDDECRNENEEHVAVPPEVLAERHIGELASNFEATVAERRSQVRRELEAKVAAGHAEVLEALRRGDASGLDGSETHPGSYLDDGVCCTWAPVPGTAGEDLVEVTTPLDPEVLAELADSA